MTPEEVCQKLVAGSLPRLWVPSAADFVQVEEIPCLGVGKRGPRASSRRLAQRGGRLRRGPS